jgi:hypothetical protein
MAITQNTFTGDGSTTNFSFTFQYIKQADVKASLDGTATTAFTFANATTLSFTTAPANGVAIRIYRDTDVDSLKATFFPGSAIKAEDLNDNFTQNNFAVQETDFDVATANTTANAAKTAADSAVSTANTASTNAAAAVSTANTASTNATNAVNTANTASTNASNAVSTANTASTNASNAVTTANSAESTANTASTNATTALNNSREDDGNGGFTSAISKANTAISTANTASTNASNAVTTANAASAAVSNAVLFDLISNVSSIPGSPSDNDYIEIGDSTGIENFTPLSGLPTGFTGASGLTVRLRYDGTNTTWAWMNYFANDSESRYIKAVVDDTTPQLGGELDAQTNKITNVGTPTADSDAATKNYVDTNSTNTNYVAVTGDTMSGNLAMGTNKVTGVGDPTDAQDAATKTYVDTANSTQDTAIGNRVVRTSATGSAELPTGTTAQRDGSPSAGYIRFNSTVSQFEGYNGTSWASVGGGATGGGSDQWAIEHDNTITTDYTISTGKNVLTAGPITVNSGVTVTVPSGSNWTIV